MNINDRLLRLLGGVELAPLRERLRSRFEGKVAISTLQLSGLNTVERAALAQLVGKPASNAKSMTLDVRAVDGNLSSAGIATSLRDALERLDGPIVDRAAMRELHRESWSQIVGSCDSPALKAWLGIAPNLGLLKRLSNNDTGQASATVARAAAVLGRFPCGGIPRAQLAAEILGDAHGLDAGRPTATVVLSVLRASRREETVDEELEDGRDRSLWATAGVLVNELAKPVLCLNVPFLDGDKSGLQLGRPTFFSLRDLVRAPPAWQVAGRTVYVCENPNVLAIAADRLGARCAPLVCTDGMPAAAQRVLLGQLVDAGARLAYHGDFDWPGLRIASHVLSNFSAEPWRMEVADYRAAAARAAERAPLSVRPECTLWNEDLASAMVAAGAAIAEEAVFEHLEGDLDLATY